MSYTYNMKHSGDEFYTRMVDIKKLLDNVDLSNYKVYCPADADWSNFVKYLTGRCKELKYTSDDFRTHDDLFEWADIIITNPPFSLFTEFLNKIYEHNKKYIIIGPNMVTLVCLKYLNKDCRIGGRIEEFEPGNKLAACKWYTNVDGVEVPVSHKKWNPQQNPDKWYTIKGTDKKIAYFCYEHVPREWDGEFLVPVTYDSSYDYLNLELLGLGDHIIEEKTFARMLARIKK